jgi:threonine synthase
VTVAVARKLVRQGRLNPDESTVLTITGNGLKTIAALQGRIPESILIEPKVDDFEEQFLSAAAAV